MSETTLVICILVGFPFVFSAIWCLVMTITSLVGGWHKLGGDYSTDVPESLEWLTWQTARVGIIDYKTCLWIAIDTKGLYLKTGPAFIYRFMHPPLLIPWKDVKEVQQKSLLFFRYVGIKVNGVGVLLPLDLEDKIKEKVAPYTV